MMEILISLIKIGLACSTESPKDRMNISIALHELHVVKNNILKLGGFPGDAVLLSGSAHYVEECPFAGLQGRMNRWIDRNKSPDAGIQQQIRALDGVVQCIHGPMDRSRANKLHDELYHPLPEVMVLQPSLKRKMEARQTWAITFTEKDMDGLSQPHNDALVLSIPIGRKMVRRVLVDQGSSAEILYYSAFKALGFFRDQLSPVDAPLVGFTGTPVYPLG
ncbi:hypothetical protein RHSIM_Rhsim04G0047900 [Rhododendron simsii]|uniref:Uncharacterized protein n=1 Tax=Rhododendron simsii TaxID=118357 RepID=A0A834LRL7_RHOSS|nr:hypothetical protein RHSIM_Rhsim04G0047900 [Rhododendron simsii]